jgi:hypothetical protein
MQFSTFFLSVTINIAMVSRILALMCSGCHLLILLTFPLLLPLLGSFLVFFRLGTTWLLFLVAYVFQILCLYTCLVHCPWIEKHHFILNLTMYTSQILEKYIWVIGRDTQHDDHFPKLGGVLLYTLPLPLPEVVPPNPLVVYIPDRVGLGLDEGFEALPPS